MYGTGITSVPILWDNREKEYIRNNTNTKLCPVMQMGRLLYYKSFNRVWQ